MLTTKPIMQEKSEPCSQAKAEMDFLIAQKMMYSVETVVWPDSVEGGQPCKCVYKMTLSDLLERWLPELDKNTEDVVSIKPI